MSPGYELRAERLRELCHTLASEEAKSRFGQLFHAAIRSDDAVLQSIMDEDCADDAVIPAFVGDFIHDNEADFEKAFSFAGLFARSNAAQSGVTNPRPSNSEARAFRHRLWKSLWQSAIRGPRSQIKGFGISWNEWAGDVTIDGSRWSSCIVGVGDERLDDDRLYERLEELGNLIRGELLAVRTVDQPNGYECAIGWIELAYSLFPQHKQVVLGIETIMLPWNLAETSARVIEFLIDKPEWRFDEEHHSPVQRDAPPLERAASDSTVTPRDDWYDRPPPPGSAFQFGTISGTLSEIVAAIKQGVAKTLRKRNGRAWYVMEVTDDLYEVWFSIKERFDAAVNRRSESPKKPKQNETASNGTTPKKRSKPR